MDLDATDLDVSESAVDAGRGLLILVGRLRRQLRGVANADQLSPAQTAVLRRLGQDGPWTMSSLAAAEGVRPQSMAATLAVLGERGLIDRCADPGDGRRQVVSLSALGRERAADYRRARHEWLVRRLQEDCTEAERTVVLRALRLLERLTGP
jgi:DNA-binding MarR family transcriptional regulator